MPCEKISPNPLLELKSSTTSLNLLSNPTLGAKPKSLAQDYYLCDRAEDRPLLAKTPGFSKPLASLYPMQILAPQVASAPSLPPPPDTPLARLLYDFTTQLKDFELSADLALPMEGIGPGQVKTFTHALLKGQGAVIQLGIEFKPYAGPQSLLKPMDQVPIFGPFFVIRILKVEMNPVSRKMEAKVKYLWFPVSKDVHADYLKKAELPPDLVKGPGWDLNKGFPVYSWQILDLLLKILEKRGAETAQKVGIDKVKPVLEKGTISITGDFSNEKVQLGGLVLHFAPLAAGEKHRLTVSGSLLEPRVKVHGLKAAEWAGQEGGIRLTNAEEKLDPLEIQLRFDPLGKRATSYEIPSYRSKKVFLEGRAKNGSALRVDLEEGMELQGLKFQSGDQGPQVEISKLRARRISFHQNGIELRTNPNDEAIFSDMKLSVVDGQVRFASQIEGKATGELKVKDGDNEVGFLKFQALDGKGRLEVRPNPKGEPVIDLSGALHAELPELRFLVQSDKLKASVRTQVRDASVGGVGRLKVWPHSQQATIEGLASDKPILIRGKGGLVTFHQDASEVESWADLKKKLGPLLAKRVVTDFFIQPQDIEFKVGKMELGRVSAEEGQAALEITKADLGPIRITGDVWGKLFARLPGGVYFPVTIPESAKMKAASIKIGRLLDAREGKDRDVQFQKLEIAGEESQATLSKKDQKRCGFDRQHIHASLGLFQFSPEDREIQIKDIDPHFHVYLKNPVSGGCLKIE